MLSVHRPVPPGRDMHASEDLFMDLDEQQSKRPRDTPSSSTQQFDFANPDEFVQRARNVSVPLPRTPEQPVPAPETPFQPVPHGNVAPETPQLSVPSTPPFQCFPGGETAPVTPRVENSKLLNLRHQSQFLSHVPMPSTFAVPSTLLPDPVVAHSHADPVGAHDHVPTQFDEESAVDTQSDDPFQFDDPPVPAPVILSQSNPVYDHRDDLLQHIRTQLQSRIRKPAQNLEPDAKRLRLDAGKRAVLMLSHDVSSSPECRKPVTIYKTCENSGCADVLPYSSSCEQGSAVRRTREVAAGTCGRCDGSRRGQVERVRSHEVLVQKAAERHHEAKPRPENRGNQMGLHGEDYPGQARLQGSTGRSRVSRGHGLHQD